MTKSNIEFVADAIDLAILRELRQDSKQSIRKLAQKVGSHPNTLIQRIKKLEEQKVIKKYSIDIDFRKLGWDTHALVLMKVKKGRTGDLKQLESITKIPQIQALYAITGNYDVAALFRVKDRDEMSQVQRKIIENSDIIRTNTSIILFTYKQPYDYNPLG
ncbi:MAG: Lrp/AsnC family transcriptional regulator [Candidatus Micrarchaeota archaeon]